MYHGQPLIHSHLVWRLSCFNAKLSLQWFVKRLHQCERKKKKERKKKSFRESTFQEPPYYYPVISSPFLEGVIVGGVMG